MPLLGPTLTPRQRTYMKAPCTPHCTTLTYTMAYTTTVPQLLAKALHKQANHSSQCPIFHNLQTNHQLPHCCNCCCGCSGGCCCLSRCCPSAQSQSASLSSSSLQSPNCRRRWKMQHSAHARSSSKCTHVVALYDERPNNPPAEYNWSTAAVAARPSASLASCTSKQGKELPGF